MVDGEVVSEAEACTISLSTVYRPLALGVRARKDGGLVTDYLVASDTMQDDGISLAYYASSHFEVLDHAIDPGWEILPGTDHLFSMGADLVKDLEDLNDRLLVRDASTEILVRKLISL